MQYIKTLSTVAIVIALAGVIVKVYTNNKSGMYKPVYYDKTTKATQSAGNDTVQEINKMYDYGDDKSTPANTNSIVMWAKIIFSGLFCLAALFVVLSNKYNDETKKWAFSVLTLIAGVWIGTVT